MVGLLATVGLAAVTLLIGSGLGFVGGSRMGDDSGEGDPELVRTAQRLGCRRDPSAVNDAVRTLEEALDAVIDATALEERGTVPADTDSVSRAEAVTRAARQGQLVEGPGQRRDTAASRPVERGESDSSDLDPVATTGTEPAGTEEVEVVPAALTGAVGAVRSRTGAETTTGRRLLEYLEAADETPERKLTDTLESVVEALDRHERIAESVGDIGPHVDADELARSLDRSADRIDGEIGEGLGIVADRLRDVVRERADCVAERDRLAENARRVCTAANEQTAVSFGSDAETAAWLDALATQLDDGTVSFADRETSVERIAGQLGLSPESKLGREFVDVLTEDGVDRTQCEQTLRSVVDAIDASETTSHRLEGVDAGDVERLAARLVDEFERVDAPASSALRNRAAELESMVSGAGSSDLVTVFAARQELRFYDLKLLKQLRDGTADTGGRTDLDDLSTDVEQRRSTIRTEYPSDYPEHDHSIPIHFLELVNSLQEAADDARATGRDERAVGYLKAADMTLDWVVELYERHAFSVLLEQLRG